MDALLISPKTEEELRFLSDLLARLGVSVALLSAEEKEDLALSMLMKEADREDKVSREEIMKKLTRA